MKSWAVWCDLLGGSDCEDMCDATAAPRRKYYMRREAGCRFQIISEYHGFRGNKKARRLCRCKYVCNSWVIVIMAGVFFCRVILEFAL